VKGRVWRAFFDASILRVCVISAASPREIGVEESASKLSFRPLLYTPLLPYDSLLPVVCCNSCNPHVVAAHFPFPHRVAFPHAKLPTPRSFSSVWRPCLNSTVGNKGYSRCVAERKDRSDLRCLFKNFHIGGGDCVTKFQARIDKLWTHNHANPETMEPFVQVRILPFYLSSC